MKIGYKKNTGKTWSFVSWRNAEDPSPGVFSMELDPMGISQLLIMGKPDTYWTSGPWDGHSFSFVPEMGSNYILNFSYTYNQEETYFTYNRQCNSTSRLVMDLSGADTATVLAGIHPAVEFIMVRTSKRCHFVHAFRDLNPELLEIGD